MDLLRLRQATADEHERVERLVTLMQPGLDRLAYVAALQRFYGFVKGWENWTAAHAPEDLLPELTERRRSLLLEQDLAFFGAPLPEVLFAPEEDAPHGVHVRYQVLGSMYVVEGSTLGGQFIADHVERELHLRRGEGNAYFAGYGDQTGAMWRRMKGMLADVPEDQSGAVIDAAVRTFGDFGRWMKPLGAAAGRSEAAQEALHG